MSGQGMVERCARVIAGYVGAPYDELPGDTIQRREWHRDGRVLDINVLTKDDCDDIARAVLAELREPTEAMLADSGTMWGFMDGYQPEGMGADQCHVEWWQSMIDAALSGRPAGGGGG